MRVARSVYYSAGAVSKLRAGERVEMYDEIFHVEVFKKFREI